MTAGMNLVSHQPHPSAVWKIISPKISTSRLAFSFRFFLRWVFVCWSTFEAPGPRDDRQRAGCWFTGASLASSSSATGITPRRVVHYGHYTWCRVGL
jgi:hypothetical protein